MSGITTLQRLPAAISSISAVACVAAWVSFLAAGTLNPLAALGLGLVVGACAPVLAKVLGQSQKKSLYVGLSLNMLTIILFVWVLLSDVPVQD